MSEQFWLPKRHAETKRLAPSPHFGGIDETGLRVYKSDPDGITVQWRVQSKHKPFHGTITHGTLTIAEARKLALYILGNWGTLDDIDTLQAAYEAPPAVEG